MQACFLLSVFVRVNYLRYVLVQFESKIGLFILVYLYMFVYSYMFSCICFQGAPRRGFLIVHVLKFSRGAVMYLPAGPSGHIISSNYDL